MAPRSVIAVTIGAVVAVMVAVPAGNFVWQSIYPRGWTSPELVKQITALVVLIAGGLAAGLYLVEWRPRSPTR